ncbi:hypothetical protein LTR94_031892, partial [Friedmanniomyces endolithicus]
MPVTAPAAGMSRIAIHGQAVGLRPVEWTFATRLAAPAEPDPGRADHVDNIDLGPNLGDPLTEDFAAT